MKKLFILFFLCSFYALTAQNNDWHKIKDLEAAYSIKFPSEPKKDKSDVSTDKGLVTMYTYTYQPEKDDKNFIYMSSFSEYPNSFFPGGLNTLDKRKKVLESAINGAVTNTKGTLLSKTEIIFNGYNGTDVKISLDTGGFQYIIRMKTILVGLKLYMTQVIYTKENGDNLNSKQFFNSFELLNVKQ
ncbi:hypothetical protein L3X37_09910 [Sabulilitoribacter arenilitoris]|uniref:DUF1795 domain-containing protein n=1 Tax=Wocania arenilitoris TaxID=2044858 RepID=A0AAE3ERA6_9FLAO|nr:hypothetical protein [Wocania arenilitoris]MCF7568680.1 hypothetical protein [Wocania arenilitoris]